MTPNVEALERFGENLFSEISWLIFVSLREVQNVRKEQFSHHIFF